MTLTAKSHRLRVRTGGYCRRLSLALGKAVVERKNIGLNCDLKYEFKVLTTEF
jgi:hypothetical protein